jgi:two-component system, OmpR family, sensor kinase
VNLRARLFAAIGAVAVVSVALAFTIGAALTRRAVERNTLRDVSAQADLLAERERVSLLPCARLTRLTAFLDRQGERALCAPVDGSSPYLPLERAAHVRRGQPADGTLTVDGERHFYAARLVGQKAFILLRPTDLVASSWRPHLNGLLIGALAAGGLAALAAFLLARAITRPVRRVAEASRSLAASRSPAPVPIEGARELASLAESFNDMAAQLAKARTTERSFLLSVSHELKTPLTAIRGYAEGLAEQAVPAEEAAETIGTEARRLERLVQDLLDLARMNRSEFSVHSEPIDLAAAAREVVRRYCSPAASFGVTLEAVTNGSAPALGDSDRTLQVASNLVENALRLTPPGGRVCVIAEPCRLVVEDTGPGLRPNELAHAFDRFFLHSRYGKERPVGTGLGLAIVKQLVEGMHGSVEVESEPGRLTRFVVRLPAVPPRADDVLGTAYRARSSV